MKMTWKKGLALLLTLTLAFGFSLQAVATEAGPDVTGGPDTTVTDPGDPNTTVVDPNTTVTNPVDPNAGTTDPVVDPNAGTPDPVVDPNKGTTDPVVDPNTNTTGQKSDSDNSNSGSGSDSNTADPNNLQRTPAGPATPEGTGNGDTGGTNENEKTHTITLMVNGAPYVSSEGVLTVEDGEMLEGLPDLNGVEDIKDSDKFSGWYTEDGTEPFDWANTPITSDLTLYARFDMDLSTVYIYFIDETGKEIETKTAKIGEPVPESQEKPLSSTEKTFRGWALQGQTELYDFKDVKNTVQGTMTFVPMYADSYYVYFYSEGTPLDPALVNAGETVAKPAEDPVRTGWTFKHWATEPKSETPYDFEKPVEGTLKLYAVWEPEKVGYEIVYWMELPNIDKAAEDLEFPNDYKSFSTASVAKDGAGALEAGTLLEDITKVEGAPANPEVQYFTYQKTEPTTISGNGHSVVNVLYSRKVYTLQFVMMQPGETYNPNPSNNKGRVYFDWKTDIGRVYKEPKANSTFTDSDVVYEFTAKYEQDTSALWPAVGTNVDIWFSYPMNANTEYEQYLPTGPTPYAWTSVSARVEGTSTAMVNGPRATLSGDIIPAEGTSIVWNAVSSTELRKQTVEFYMEALPGQTGVDAPVDSFVNDPKDPDHNLPKGSADGKQYVLDPTRTETNKVTGDYVFDIIPGYIPVGKVRERVNNKEVIDRVYYNRQVLSLQFNKNLGTGGPGTITDLLHGQSLKGSTPTQEPTRAGYDFAGWYYDSDCKLFPVDWENDLALYSKNASDKDSSVITVFAKWTSNENIVSFYDKQSNANGGETGRIDWQGVATGDTVVQKTLKLNDVALVPGAMVPEYGEFLGWYWDFKGSPAWFSDEMPIKDSINVYAVWRTDGFTVSYVAEGASGTVPTDDGKYSVNALVVVKSGGGLSLNGQVFTGWMDQNRNFYLSGSTLVVQGNTVLTAQFMDSTNGYTVTYKPMHEEKGAKEMREAYQNTNKNVTLADGNALFPREGYEFAGWKVLSGGDSGVTSYAAGEIYAVGKTVVLEAQWEKFFDVKFVTEGEGTLDGTAEFRVKEGTAWESGFTVPTPTPNDGNYFAGWSPEFPATVTDNATYTAKFAPKTEVTFTAKDKTKTFDGTALILAEATAQGLKTGDSFTVTMTPNSTITNAGQTDNVIASVNITRDGKDVNGEYTLRPFQTGTLTVEKAEVTVEYGKNGKTYGDNDPTDYNITIEGLGDNPKYTVERKPGEDVGSYDLTVKLPDSVTSENYNITNPGGTFTISKLAITVVGKSASLPFNNTVLSVEGFSVYKSSDMENALTALPLGDVITMNPNPKAEGRLPGTYDVIVVKDDVAIDNGGASKLGNYEISVKNGLLTIGDPEPGTKFGWSIVGKHESVPFDGKSHTITDTSAAPAVKVNLPEGFTLAEGSLKVTNPNERNVNRDVNGTDSTQYMQDIDVTNVKIMLGDDDVTEWFADPATVVEKGSLTITPAVLTITLVVTPERIAENSEAPKISLQYDGFEEDDDESNAFSTMPNINTGGFDPKGIKEGRYIISVSGATAKNANYDIHYKDNNVILTVAAAGAMLYHPNNFPFQVPEDKKTYAAGDKPTINTEDISAAGYEFLGWAHSATDTEPDFKVGEENRQYEFTPEDAAEGKILYAVGKVDFTGEGAITATGHTSEYNGKNEDKDGKPKSISVSTTITNDVIWYATEVDEDGKLVDPSTTNPAFKDASTYTVYYQVQRGKDFSEVASQDVVITPIKIKVSADAVTITRGDPLPDSYNHTVGDGVLAGEDPGLVIDGLSATGYNPMYPVSGTYDIVFGKDSKGNNGNYDVSFVKGTLTVDPARQMVYDPNGGTGGPSDTGYYGNGANVDVDFDNVPTRPGYEFLGWHTDNKNLEAPAYTKDGTTGFTMAATDDSDYTLYAAWKVGNPAELGFSFESFTKVYDGKATSLAVTNSQNVPFTVEYSYKGTTSNDPISFVNVADSGEVTATIKIEGVETPFTMSATGTITGRPFSMAAGAVPNQTYNAASLTGSTSVFTDNSTDVDNTGEVGLLDGHVIIATASASETNAGTYDLELTYGPYVRDGEGKDVSGNYKEVVSARTLGTFTIDKAEVTVTANSKTMLYKGTAPALTASFSNMPEDSAVLDGFYELSLDQAYLTMDAGTYTGAIVAAAGVEDPLNYKLSFVNGDLTIAASNVQVIITPDDKSQVYGDAAKDLSYTVQGTLDGDTLPTYELERDPGDGVGDYKISVVQESGGSANYANIHFEEGTYSITPAPASIQPNNSGKNLGENDPALTATVTGAKNGETLNYTVNRDPGDEAGTYGMYVENYQTENPNYKVNVGTGVFTITGGTDGPIIVPVFPTQPPQGGTTTPGDGGPAAITPAGPAAPAAPAAAPPAALPVVAPVVTANPLAGLGTLLGALTNLTDPANPLANQTVNIANNEVPLAGFGAWALVNLLLAIATVVISLVLLVTYFVGKRKKKEDQQAQQDDDYEFERIDQSKNENEEANRGKLKRKLIVRLVSVVVAVVSVIAFILTEDITQPMVLIDNWTLLMAIIAFVQVIVTFFAKKARKDEENEEDSNDTQPMNV